MATEHPIVFPEADAPLPKKKSIGPNASLLATVEAYRDYMESAGFSTHTVKAFSGDLRLFQNYVGSDTLVHDLGTNELNQFLYWLQYKRGVSCSPKSYARRVTTLKSFFGWLTSIKVTPFDPAAAVLHQRITTPLPVILQDEEVDRLLEVTEKLTTGKKADPRPHLLVNLLLQTGIKKAECMRLTIDDFEDADPESPTVLIRYQDLRMLHKERRIDVSPELMDTLKQYLALYKPVERVFECTARNLEYVLTDMAKLAQIPGGVSFESLRWTSAVRDFKDGMSHDKLQVKMGLSKVTFRETLKKLEKLANGEKE